MMKTIGGHKDTRITAVRLLQITGLAYMAEIDGNSNKTMTWNVNIQKN